MQRCPIWLAGIAALFLCNASLAESRNRAVLVGINDYQSGSVKDLTGTHNDVNAMQTLLVNRYGFGDPVERQWVERLQVGSGKRFVPHPVRTPTPRYLSAFVYSLADASSYKR